MHALIAIDESGSLQEIDASLALPSTLTSAIGDLGPIERAVTAAGPLTFGHVTDVAFMKACRARLSRVVFGVVGVDADGAGSLGGASTSRGEPIPLRRTPTPTASRGRVPA